MIYSIRVAFDLNVNAGENILAIFKYGRIHSMVGSI